MTGCGVFGTLAVGQNQRVLEINDVAVWQCRLKISTRRRQRECIRLDARPFCVSIQCSRKACKRSEAGEARTVSVGTGELFWERGEVLLEAGHCALQECQITWAPKICPHCSCRGLQDNHEKCGGQTGAAPHQRGQTEVDGGGQTGAAPHPRGQTESRHAPGGRLTSVVRGSPLLGEVTRPGSRRE